MLTLPARDYLLAALDNTPATLAALLSGFPADHVVWNTRPTPDRFSLREIVAHLADWDEVWRWRFERTVNEDKPYLARPSVDERAQEKAYDRTDPVESLAHFQERRAGITAWLRSLPVDAWARMVHLERMGELTLDELAPLVLSHDSYHVRQVGEWLTGE